LNITKRKDFCHEVTKKEMICLNSVKTWLLVEEDDGSPLKKLQGLEGLLL
jgi:hypothetical protein